MPYYPNSPMPIKRPVYASLTAVIVATSPAQAQQLPRNDLIQPLSPNIEEIIKIGHGRGGTLIVSPGTPISGTPPTAPPSVSPQESERLDNVLTREETFRSRDIARFSSPLSVKNTSDNQNDYGDYITSRLDKKFYPSGFNEVVALVVKSKFQCSAVLIDTKWALTAAHCVTNQTSSGEIAKLDENSLFLYTPASKGKDCFDAIDPINRASAVVCEYIRRSINRINLHPSFISSGQLPRTDIALIELSEPIIDGIKPATIPPLPSNLTHSDVTLAGFGYTGIPGDIPGDIVEVGWHFADFNYSDGTITWKADTAGQSSTCHFDSGGPIFSGVMQGYTSEQHLVVGIVVGMSTEEMIGSKSNVAAKCRSGKALNALLSNLETSKWICSVTKSPLSMCNH